jgi:hypothetical protein
MRRATALRLSLVIASVALVMTATGCVRQAPPPQLAKLRIVAEPDTTTVYVDERYVGSARVLAAKPKSLSPGVKLVTFKAPGYFPHDVRLDLPSGTTTVHMKLRKIPL